MTCKMRVFALAAVPLALVLAACQAQPAEPQKPAAAPAAQAQTAAPTAKLFLATDMVLGSKNLSDAEKSARSCVLASRFPRNSEMVWRVRVGDPVSGKLLGSDELSKLEVRLGNGTVLEAKYGPHPKDPPGESFWTASWVVPKDHPTGSLDYTVVATGKDGRAGEWKPFSTKPSLLTITDETLADVPVKPAAPAKPKA